MIIDRDPHPVLVRLEYVCIVWFSFEYFMKMLVSANRWRTFRQALNIIDLLAILPFMIEMSLSIFGVSTEQLQDLKVGFIWLLFKDQVFAGCILSYQNTTSTQSYPCVETWSLQQWSSDVWENPQSKLSATWNDGDGSHDRCYFLQHSCLFPRKGRAELWFLQYSCQLLVVSRHDVDG